MTDRADRLVDKLMWHDVGPARRVVSLDGVPMVAFERSGPRVVTELAFMNGRRFIDVTVQPEAPSQLVRAAAIRRRRDPNAWEAAVARRLVEAADRWGIDGRPDDRDRLAPVVGALGFPLIRLAARHGVAAPPFVPRWAAPILACGEVREAASAAFAGAANRRVVRVLPASLVGGGRRPGRPPSLVPLALAMALSGLVEPDPLANVLSADSVEHPPHHWPTVDQLAVLRRAFADLGPDAASAVAVDALASVEGPSRLVTIAPQVGLLSTVGAAPPPHRVDGLVTAVEDLHRPAPVRAEIAPRPTPRIDLPTVPQMAPAGPRAAAGRVGGFDHSTEALRIDGVRLGDHHLSLPRDGPDLRSWGERLHNCIADYSPAVAAGRSVVVGVHRRERLVAALELDPGLTRVRQFVRDRNQRPRAAERDAVSRMLRHLGIAGGRSRVMAR